MFEDTTVEGIKQRILSSLKTTLQTREGSFVNDIISAVAVELHDCYHQWDSMEPRFYVGEDSGPYIDKQAAAVGIYRKPGTAASCSITFSGKDGARVPAGTPFYTESGLTFILQEDVVIASGTASGVLVAAEAGGIYNIGTEEITSTLRNYSGISAYTNAAASGGADQETDEALVARYYERMRRSPTSGNPYHYQEWATSVAGVGAARVISKWNGAGTVKVVLAGPDLEPVADGIISACAAYIEDQRPVGPAVTVVSAAARNITVSASVQVDGTTTAAAVQTALRTSVAAYLRELTASAFHGNIDMQLESLDSRSYTVLYNRIAYLLLSIPGVIDYTSLKVNGGAANIVVGAAEVPVLAEVSVT